MNPSLETASEFDVICGRGRSTFNHAGNKRFRDIVRQHLKSYSSATDNKTKKSNVISSVIKDIRSSGGNFVKYRPETGRFENVSERLAREKVGGCMRDILHFQYSSSTTAKKYRRIAKKNYEDEQIQNVVESNTHINSILKLANEVIEYVEFISDEDFENHFTLVNEGILAELKQSKSIEILNTNPMTQGRTR